MGNKDRLGCWLQIRKIRQTSHFPTLFSKLFTVYIGILLVILILFYIIFSNAFRSYFIDHTQGIMKKQAEMIAEEYKAIGEFRQSVKTGINRILFKMEVFDKYLDATVWIVDRNNVIHVASDNVNKAFFEKNLPIEDIEKVFDGYYVARKTGFEQYFTTPVVTIGYPIEVFGNVEYALFIHTPMPQIEKTIAEVRSMTLKTVAVTIFVTFILIYFMSKQITKPLKQMNTVAKQIAGGDFDKRIEREGEDEISELAASLNYMASELGKIESSRKSFIANVSHDMRSPLTSIQGFVTAMLDGTIPQEKQDKYLNIVLNESQRMIKMANDILELNKLEEGNLPLKKSEFDIHEMIRDLVENLSPRIKEKELTVNLILDDKIQNVVADPEKIARVVQNLLDNAFKFVNNQGIIEVETIAKGSKVWVYIRNNGPMIPKEEQQVIWERFYKADLSRGKDKKGMGIGLVIVKEIIKQHQETLGIRSEEGEMVTFYFSLSK